jgi:signal peptidase II
MSPQAFKDGLQRMIIGEKCRKYGMPFILASAIVILDQITKAFIVLNWPIIGTFIKDVFGNSFLYIVHVRNKAIAFSIGSNVPYEYRFALFVLIPIAVLVFLLIYYFKSTEFTQLQRWAVAGIIGGGFGNIIDRIFREDGVVDFISVKFYGIFGLERLPTFNVADAGVVVCCFVLLV